MDRSEPDTWQHRPPQPAANEGGIVVVAFAVLTVIAVALLVVGCIAGWLLHAAVGP